MTALTYALQDASCSDKAKIQRAKDGTPVVVGARDYRKSHRFCGARAIGSAAECLK